jgi:tRNA(Arg) A34 adenosine deaminase TadA
MSVPRPDWMLDLAREAEGGSLSQLLDQAIAIACESARREHGPFGAIVADAEGAIVAAGHNRVIADRDSTMHAEIHAIRAAEHELASHDLGAGEPLTMYASCEPCVMCFGAIYWSGLDRIAAAAPAEAAEALGFEEGPVTDAMWATAREDKGIVRAEGVEPTRDPEEPFRVCEEQGGEIY